MSGERTPATFEGPSVRARERFEAVALPHLDAVYRMARRLAGNEAEAEDLVQDTFLRALRAFGTFELRGYGAKPWLLKILYNAFCSRRTRQAREPALLDDKDFDQFGGEATSGDAAERDLGEIDWEQVDDEIKAAVDALRPEYRAVLLLWAVENLSYKEIAEVCDCAVGTVMSRLYRARQQAGGHLAAYAGERNTEGKRTKR